MNIFSLEIGETNPLHWLGTELWPEARNQGTSVYSGNRGLNGGGPASAMGTAISMPPLTTVSVSQINT